MELQDALFTTLTTQKHTSGMYNMYANEAASENLKQELMSILSETHDASYATFTELNKRGFYPTPKAESAKVTEVKDKFSKYS